MTEKGGTTGRKSLREALDQFQTRSKGYRSYKPLSSYINPFYHEGAPNYPSRQIAADCLERAIADFFAPSGLDEYSVSVFMSEQAKLWEAHTRRSKEIIGGPRIANSSNGNTTSKGMAQDPIGLILLVHLGSILPTKDNLHKVYLQLPKLLPFTRYGSQKGSTSLSSASNETQKVPRKTRPAILARIASFSAALPAALKMLEITPAEVRNWAEGDVLRIEQGSKLVKMVSRNWLLFYIGHMFIWRAKICGVKNDEQRAQTAKEACEKRIWGLDDCAHLSYVHEKGGSILRNAKGRLDLQQWISDIARSLGYSTLDEELDICYRKDNDSGPISRKRTRFWSLLQKIAFDNGVRFDRFQLSMTLRNIVRGLDKHFTANGQSPSHCWLGHEEYVWSLAIKEVPIRAEIVDYMRHMIPSIDTAKVKARLDNGQLDSFVPMEYWLTDAIEVEKIVDFQSETDDMESDEA